MTIEHILDSHFEQTVERCRAERLVLAAQDTTTLNYDGLSATSGLDELGVVVNAVGHPRDDGLRPRGRSLGTRSRNGSGRGAEDRGPCLRWPEPQEDPPRRRATGKKSEPLPGTQKLWEGVRFLSHAVIALWAIQEWDRNQSEGEKDTDSSV